MRLSPAGTMLKDKANWFRRRQRNNRVAEYYLGLESFEKVRPSPSPLLEILVTLGLYLEGNLPQPHIGCGIQEQRRSLK
jgi:hypothetical protein